MLTAKPGREVFIHLIPRVLHFILHGTHLIKLEAGSVPYITFMEKWKDRITMYLQYRFFSCCIFPQWYPGCNKIQGQGPYLAQTQSQLHQVQSKHKNLFSWTSRKHLKECQTDAPRKLLPLLLFSSQTLIIAFWLIFSWLLHTLMLIFLGGPYTTFPAFFYPSSVLANKLF